MSANPESVRDGRRIVHFLQQMKTRRVTLSTRPYPSPVTASTLVVNVDPTRSAVVLDALFPSPAQAAVRRGTLLEFSTRLDGIDVRGKLRVRDVQTRSDGDLVVAEMPGELLWSQKRAAYRVPALSLPSSQLLVRGGRFRTRVLDLSVLGLGAEVNIDSVLDSGSHAICELSLPDIHLIAGVEIRSSSGPSGRVRIGTRYTELSRNQRVAIERTTIKLQREALQRQHAQH